MATISLHHVRTCLDGARRRGSDCEELMTRAGIHPTTTFIKGDRVHTEPVGRLFRLIQQDLNDEFMGFTRNPCKYGAFATLCKLTAHCRNLGELLERAVELYNLLTEDLSMRLDSGDGRARFSFTLDKPELDEQHFLAEFILVIWHRFPSWYIGEAIRLRETHFANPVPAHREELQIMFPGRLRFNQSEYCLSFDAAYLEKPLARRGQEVEHFLHNHPQDVMTIPGVDESVEAQVERLLIAQRRDNPVFPSAEEMAHALGTGTVTLYRKLRQEGTSYQRIKDNIRREESIDLLLGDPMSVEDISDRVGFSDARSFTRAFRTWTGLSPRQYRSHHGKRD